MVGSTRNVYRPAGRTVLDDQPGDRATACEPSQSLLNCANSGSPSKTDPCARSRRSPIDNQILGLLLLTALFPIEIERYVVVLSWMDDVHRSSAAIERRRRGLGESDTLDGNASHFTLPQADPCSTLKVDQGRTKARRS